MPRDQFVSGLASTVMEMFSDGNDDPCYEEIAVAYMPEKALPKEFVESVRKRLPKVRRMLEEVYEEPFYLVNETYYVRYREAEPETDASAHSCLPLGYGVAAFGLRRHRGDDDLIWQATRAQGLAAGAGQLKRNADRTLEAVDEHRLSDGNAGRLLNDAQQAAVPDRLEVAQRVAGALSEGKEEE